MIIVLASVGRSRNSAEDDLTSDYIDRAAKIGRNLGVKRVSTLEVDASGGATVEAQSLVERIPKDANLIVCDEIGDDLTSRDFAKLLARWRDSGVPSTYVCVGGADGWTDDFRARANYLIRFGRQTWPHKLARVMAAEQVYRAMTILAGSPYHRD